MNEKVAVVGGGGFLGSHLADQLSATGFDVSIVDKIESPWIRPDQTMICADILDFKQVLEAIDGSDYVYHLAGVADIAESAVHPREAIQVNITGSTNIVAACLENKVRRLLFASSVYVYSNRGSFYRVTKQATESIIEAYHDEFNLEYTILRYGSLYGPRAQDWNGLKRLVRQGLQENRIVYPGTGEERREYIHVIDAARLSIKALDPAYANECLTITGTQIMTTRNVMEMIREISGQDMEIGFSPSDSIFRQSHYTLTPYRYTPRRGRKLISNNFIDLGQGILDLIEEIDQG